MSSGRTEALRLELERYQDLYRIPAALLEPDGSVLLGSRSSFEAAREAHPELSGIVTAALAGYRPEPPGVRWPWDDRPLIVAEPVGRDSEVVGVVVTVSPTDRTRAGILERWGQLAALGLLPLVALAAVAWPVSGWVLRPVRQLDSATDAITKGDLTIRANDVNGPVELRRLATSFNTMMDAVEHASERQRAFVSDASHQLRNPLTSLRLAVENLEPHLHRPAAREAHAIAVDEAKAMHRMLNSLLAAARMESMRSAVPVELDTVLMTRAGRWRALAASAGFALEMDVPPGLRVLEPPGGLGSVLDELVSNALRLSGGGRVSVAAAESAPAHGGPQTSRGLVEIRVSDDGSGLGDGEYTRALQRFWRSPRHQNTAGTGLGLAICAELVEAAGGRVRLEPGLPSAEGRGLAAVVALPAAPESSGSDDKAPAPARFTSPDHSASTMRDEIR
nr:HAMP domain-containing sensor histidine kinase [Phytoactinopolyspora alkaliphila]